MASLIKNHISVPQQGGSKYLETPDGVGEHPGNLEHHPSPLNLPLSGAQGWGHTPRNAGGREMRLSPATWEGDALVLRKGCHHPDRRLLLLPSLVPCSMPFSGCHVAGQPSSPPKSPTPSRAPPDRPPAPHCHQTSMCSSTSFPLLQSASSGRQREARSLQGKDPLTAAKKDLTQEKAGWWLRGWT